jgi:hypothetical protein
VLQCSAWLAAGQASNLLQASAAALLDSKSCSDVKDDNQDFFFEALSTRSQVDASVSVANPGNFYEEPDLAFHFLKRIRILPIVSFFCSLFRLI